MKTYRVTTEYFVKFVDYIDAQSEDEAIEEALALERGSGEWALASKIDNYYAVLAGYDHDYDDEGEDDLGEEG